MARALLESHGLRPTLRDVSMAGLDWQLVPALGGVRLEVPRAEVRRARELLATGERRLARLHDAGEVEYFESARRRRRWVGVTAMFLLSPWFGVVGWLLGRRAARRDGAAAGEPPPVG